jgi:hypothetical protein
MKTGMVYGVIGYQTTPISVKMELGGVEIDGESEGIPGTTQS